MVEVEWILARDGAVEPRLDEGCPLVLEGVSSATVLLADSPNSGKYGLKLRFELNSVNSNTIKHWGGELWGLN